MKNLHKYNSKFDGVYGRPKSALYMQVLALRRDGHSYDGIALILSMHRQTVASICQKNSLGGRRNAISEKPIIDLRIEKNLSYGSIAQNLKLSVSTVRSICQRKGLGGRSTKN